MASEAVLAASLDKKKVGLVGIYGSKEDMITFYKASIVSYFLSPFKKDIIEAWGNVQQSFLWGGNFDFWVLLPTCQGA